MESLQGLAEVMTALRERCEHRRRRVLEIHGYQRLIAEWRHEIEEQLLRRFATGSIGVSALKRQLALVGSNLHDAQRYCAVCFDIGAAKRILLGADAEIHRFLATKSVLERLRRLDPDDPVVKVSLAELLLEARPQAPGVCRRVVRLAEGAGNETPVHAALLLYKAKALRRLGLPEAARNVLTGALRRRKGLSEELLRALRPQ